MAKFFYLAFILVCTQASAESFERYNKVTQYDQYFSKYSKRSFGPNFDWRYFKAQAIAESRLKRDAQSQVGAVGIMQIMPRTYAEILKRNRYIKGSDKNPRWNIAAGIYYNRSIWKIFKAERPFQDRLDFMFGAYNAGKGNILKAQRHTMTTELNPNLWASIEKTLPQVTGKHSKETIAYVDKIKEVKSALK
ncbi:MAG: transglycosylase SLT domain-containing protein [Gammaproteobacteria bacterium]